MPIERVLKAIDEIKKGKMVILSDDEDRENEGDLTMAAELVTPEAINFMAKYGRGLICLSLTEDKCRELDLPLMVQDNTAPYQTGFTVSIDASKGTTTGISAADRALTILTAVKDDCNPEELGRPGHIFPLRSLPGGALRRTGQTEGSVDLCRLAGLKPAGIICEIMNDDGTMARMPELKEFAKKHDLHIVTVADIIQYLITKESLVKRMVDTPKEKQPEEGIKICIESIERLKECEGVRGFHVMAIEWEETVPEIVEATGLYPRPSVE